MRDWGRAGWRHTGHSGVTARSAAAQAQQKRCPHGGAAGRW
eukprot:CAMPEP_0206402626 /NCGR_PEP_ID=MMETSP0294-20121207/27119_1 /ASSEMBLY_ACC=CAM_ASM_000327 /TAXON_ID=39354 /ORGANISM="Heterosigma akashiwo, Strain CCMP2393" /LENGTH=40 /DNA_ID= /DNA_START= /DNA_END= /DNA_ORIENTATION=